MRFTSRAALAFAIIATTTVGPIGAATARPTIIAQASQGTLSGTVSDAAGRPIAGAVVNLDGAGARQTTTTDAQGHYSFSVGGGIYTLTINKGGFQTGSSDVTVEPGASATANATLTQANLSNLTTIGRTSASAQQNTALRLNISSSAQGSIGSQVIQERNLPSLNNLVTEIPGVTVNHSSSNPNTSFYIRGTAVEAKTLIDGHPIASGTSGTTLSLFANAAIFGAVDVLKGAGIGSPTAGYSGVGTINLRSQDFTPKNTGFFQLGLDQYGGTEYQALASLNFLDNKLQVLFGKSFYGYLGPQNNQTGNVIGAFAPTTLTSATGVTANYSNVTRVPNYGYLPGTYANATIGWQGDLSNVYALQGYVGKIRYNFSDTTSVTGSFLGLYGDFEPQGGAYAQYIGQLTVPYCLNGTTKAPVTTAAGCTALGNTALYNNPSSQNLIGQTVPLYTFYPGSSVHFRQPIYNFDFKTAIGNDTLLLRPYSAQIQRLINGQNEQLQFGYSGNVYQVTSNAQCQVVSVNPSAAAQAKGPCLPAGAANGTPAFVGSDTTPTSFVTGPLPTGYTCSAATPCYVSQTSVTNTGAYGYTTPYTTFETDQLFGYTASYIHPFGANTANISFDHYYDQASALVNDASPFAAGCTPTLGGGTLPAGTITYNGNTYGAQPTCTAFPAGVSRSSPISVPPTFSSVSSLSGTLQFQVTPKLELDWGNYFTYFNINAQIEDPNFLNAYVAAFNSTSSAPVLLVGAQNAAAHYDPHFGLTYRATRDLVLRATGGSSIAIPYAAQVSGLGSINLAGVGASQTATVNLPNPALRPENVVAYDAGFDYRFAGGTIVSTDLYNNVVYNSWLSPTISIPQPAGSTLGAGGYFQSKPVNAGNEIFQGFELAIGNEPRIGFGGKASVSMERAYYMNLPASIVQSPINAGTGQPIITPITAFNGEQIAQIPYTRGYAEIRYAGPKDQLYRVGVDYEGNNNAYNVPAFFLVDASIRIPLVAGITFQASGYNIFNFTNGSLLSEGIYNQGRVQVGNTYLPSGLVSTNIPTNGAAVNNPTSVIGTSGAVNPGFQLFTFSLQKKF